MSKRFFTLALLPLSIAVLFLITLTATSARQQGGAVPIDADDLGGVVTSSKGPEAGVWVIAETTELPSKFVRIVVTDDRGRYLMPDLPAKATYSVWVRGYGLVDSPKVRTTAGRALDLTASIAPSPAASAEYYPAGYWWAMLQVPGKNEFPGTGPTGNGISPDVRTQAEFLRQLKSGGCWACHQLGNKATREIPKELGTFASSVHAWDRRVQSGQAGGNMVNGLNGMGRERALKMFAEWTDRIAAGAIPKVAPPRPQGIERNVVITMWDWADPTVYLHDVVTTDRRNPTVNANGPVYGALELSADYVPVLDPVRHAKSQIPLTVRDPETPRTSPKMAAPSPYWGTEVIWTSRNNVHNPMLDERGRVWLTSAVRVPDNPAFCKEGSSHPSAKLFPLPRAGRHLAVWDPKSDKLTHIATCFGTHHLMFAEDASNTLWTSGGGQVVGWFNTKMFEETGDEEKSQGWTALILDTNGNGKRDDYVEPKAACGSGQGHPFRRRVLRRGAGTRRLGLGHAARFSGSRHPVGAWCEPAGDHTRRGLSASVRRSKDAGLFSAGWRRRSPRRLLDGAGQRSHGQLRSPQVQGSAERPEGDGAALPRGLDLVYRTVAAAGGRDRSGQRRGQLLHVGRSVRHIRAGRQHADQHRQRVGGIARAQGRQMGGDACALPARFLHQVGGWPD